MKFLELITKLPIDKLGHSLVGLFIYTLLVLFVAPVYAFFVVVFIAIAKEIYDLNNKDRHTPDFYDFLATIILPAFVVIVYYLKEII